MKPLTPQQRTAVECRDASVVLASGAGCGKTHVLTERFLDHLRRDGVDVGQLLAITFTDRAARQMRQRIRQAILHEVRQADDAAAERWLRHLRGLETAHVSTIHAFCSSLLRRHAVEAGLDPAFEVLEEVLAVNLRQHALTRCLQELLTSTDPPAADLRELIVLYGWDGTQRAVERLMRHHQPAEWQAWLDIPAEQVAAGWQGEERRRLLPRCVDYLIRGVPKISRCLRLLATTPCQGPLMREDIAYLLRELPRLHEAEDVEAAVQELIECAKVGKERGKAWESDAVYQVIKQALSDFRGQLRDKMALFLDEPEDVVDAVIVGQRFLRVADAAARAYQQNKRQESVVDFEDLLALARDLLRDHAEVRAGLQERYRFILIDELQDTDPVQHELIALLCGEGLVRGKLFAVGDHQQSIYRFRGAAVELFTQLRSEVPEAGRQTLSVNFRSQPAILDFSNALFAHHLRHFQALTAFHPQVNSEPCIEFLWSREAGGSGQESETESPEDDAEQPSGAAEDRAREADAIAKRIRIMLDDGERLVRDGAALRAVRAGDIAILFRSMSSVGIYERALRQHDVDYYLVGGRAFFAQQEIYDLLHLLRALENPQDELSLAGTLRSPFCCLSDEALFWLAQHRDGLWTGLHDTASRHHLSEEQRERAGTAARLLERWRSLKDRLPIARLIGEVFADSGYDAAMQLEFLGDRKLANLWKLQELARTFDRSGRFGLAEFIARLDDLVAAQPREEQAATQPENADVVRIMSIHQAKGLEFPVVIVPDLGHVGGDPRGQPAWWHPTLGCLASPPKEDGQVLFSRFGWELGKADEAIAEWHEELRALYVACTRAEDYLVLSAALPEPFRPENAWMLLLSERFNIQTGQCLDAAIPAERVPNVRVTFGEELRSAERGARSAESNVVVEIDARGVEAAPLRVAGSDVIAVTGLEEFLRCRQTGRTFDPSLLTSAEPPGSLRSILQAWGFRGPDGWRPFLGEATDLEAVLVRFAGSELGRQLGQAGVVHQALEYVVKWSNFQPQEEPSLFRPTELPSLWGLLDCLWQDEAGRWHLVCWGIDPARTLDEERRRLAIAAHAVLRQTGAWPASFAVYRFQEEKLQRFAEKELRQPRLLAEITASLEEILEQRWSG